MTSKFVSPVLEQRKKTGSEQNKKFKVKQSEKSEKIGPMVLFLHAKTKLIKKLKRNRPTLIVGSHSSKKKVMQPHNTA
jgi:hypothetical protein